MNTNGNDEPFHRAMLGNLQPSYSRRLLMTKLDAYTIGKVHV